MVSLRTRRYGNRRPRLPLLGAVSVTGLALAGACTVDEPEIGLLMGGTSSGGTDGSSLGAAASGLSGAGEGGEPGGQRPDNMGGAPEAGGRAGSRNTTEGGSDGSTAGNPDAAGTGGSQSTHGGGGGGGGSSTAGSAGSGGGSGGGGSGSGGSGGSGGAPDVHSGPFGILVLEKTLEFRHDSIQACEDTLTTLGKTSNAQMPPGTKPGSQFTITIAKDDLSDFTDTGLKNYALVFFCQPTGRVFSTGGPGGAPDTEGMMALQKFVEGGGAWAGVHAALDFEKTGGFPWFSNTLTGTTWTIHDTDGTQATVQVAAAFSGHPVVSGVPASWSAADEWYHWQTDISTLPGFQILQVIAADQRPVTWIKQINQGRMFYTSRGHNKNYYAEASFQRLILNGVLWATQRLN